MLRDKCHAFLLAQLPPELRVAAEAAAGRGQLAAEDDTEGTAGDTAMEVDVADQLAAASLSPARWGIAPFFVDRQVAADGTAASVSPTSFNFRAPSTGRNALRVLRALQLRKPILLEGSPGVGKTSLVAAMAKAVGAPGCTLA
jgi:midasin